MNLKITLKRSKIRCTKSQKATLACLGLRKINQSRSFKESPVLKGQINKVKHLVFVEPSKEEVQKLSTRKTSSKQKKTSVKKNKFK